MAAMGASITAYDQEKYLVQKLLERSEQRCVAAALCDQDMMKEGAGLIAYMVRYVRMNIPLSALSEGTTPSESAFSLEQVSVTLDQWGDYVILTDVIELTTNHPVMEQALDLLADNAARVMDREVQLVMLAGTNVLYGDLSVTARASVTSSMVISNTIIGRVRAGLARAGVPPKGRSSADARAVAAQGNFLAGAAYVAVCGPEVIADIQLASTSFGTFAAVATYNNAKAMYNGEVGQWLGFRWVETNFIPRYQPLGSATAAVASGNAFGTDTPVVTAATSGGALTDSTAHYFKVTRKSLLDGFEDEISVRHSMSTGAAATADDNSFTFNFGSLTAGYVYAIYIGTTNADASLHLVAENVAVGTTTTVTAVGTGRAAIANLDSTISTSVHPVYFLGAAALGWTGFYKPRFLVARGGGKDVNVYDPLDQKRTAGYKFFGKAVIKDQTRLQRLEIASSNG